MKGFLEDCGFTELDDTRSGSEGAQQQILFGKDPKGNSVGVLVRCTWYKASQQKVAASQLVKEGADEAVMQKAGNAKKQHATHFLFVERSGGHFQSAAYIRVDDLYPAWKAQKEEMDRLLAEGGGRVGRILRNQALNGSSATLTLRDDRLPESFSHKLWNFATDLAKTAPLSSVGSSAAVINDTYDDYGSDNPERKIAQRSGVVRDDRVRKAVRMRAKGTCERCHIHRDFTGFLDVHHVLGADKSDRPWTCVAVCPNCHREAHFAPDAETINMKLLKVASQSKSS